MLALLGIVTCADAVGQTENEAGTVIGPSNIDLADGAAALRVGNAVDGVRLTQRGLQSANNDRDRVAGYSNLCAGFIMLDDLDAALEACNRALEIDDGHWRSYSNRALVLVKQKRYTEAERDIDSGQALSPHSRTLRAVKAMLLDATDPVSPTIIIDDRRHAPPDDAE
jgi:Flp pilus assembly protein TadD